MFTKQNEKDRLHANSKVIYVYSRQKLEELMVI